MRLMLKFKTILLHCQVDLFLLFNKRGDCTGKAIQKMMEGSRIFAARGRD
jgi:hypothetical protein